MVSVWVLIQVLVRVLVEESNYRQKARMSPARVSV